MKYVRHTFFYFRLGMASILLLSGASISAQSIWLNSRNNHTIALEIIRPNYNNMTRNHDVFMYDFAYDYRFGLPTIFIENGMYPVDYATFNTLISFLSYSRPLGRIMLIESELPYACTDFDMRIVEDYSFFQYTGHESTFGNPYIGVKVRPKSWFSATAGIRPALLSDKFIHISNICAFTVPDRLEAFHKNASAKISWSLQLRYKSGFGVQLENGVTCFFPTGRFKKPWWNFPVCLSVGIDNKRMTLNYILYFRFEKGHENGFGSSLCGTTGFTAALQMGKLRPGAQVSLTAFEGYRILNIGLHLGYQIKKRVHIAAQ